MLKHPKSSRRDPKLPELSNIVRAASRLPTSFSRVRGGRENRARVNPAQTTDDKQRCVERFMLSARNTYWGCLAQHAAPRIPEACWIASQTHSLPVPLCYCCQGGGRSTDVISAPWERSRELRLSTDFFFFFHRESERAFLPVAGRD